MDIVNKLKVFFASANSPVLFAGAGVSVHAGAPTWHEYLERIAQQTETFDLPTSQIMRARIKEGDLVTAADYYFLCNRIPEIRKQEILVEPFNSCDSSKVLHLASLPFRSIVTTNYDRSLFDAFAAIHSTSPREVNLGDPSLRSAAFETNFYIARIHGRMEIPETMVLSGHQFNSLQSNQAYKSFLTHIFTKNQVLFVGFSFLDPAIKAVLHSIQHEIGSWHDGEHLALVPDSSSPELVKSLAAYNIGTVNYPSAGSHDSLWRTLASTPQFLSKEQLPKAAKYDPFYHSRRFLATTYARNQLGPIRKPLRDIIFEGMVAQLIKQEKENFHQLDDIVIALQEEIHLHEDALRSLVHSALDRLVEDGLCSKESLPTLSYKWEGGDDDSFSDAINKLVDGAIDRYVVRHGGREAEDVRRCMDGLIRNALLTRGWDLGASFASGKVPDGVEFLPILDGTDECACFGTSIEARRIAESVKDVFQKPDSVQSVLLSQLGRISFGLELALETPRDALLHSLTLPERIYLDTNVLLPAIVPHHPFHDLYNTTVSRLLAAAAESMIQLEIVISREFVEEIVSHKKIALREFELMGCNVREELRKDVALYGSRNINVYLSGFINSMDRNDEGAGDFLRFLKEFAPYSSILELRSWLADKGIHVVDKNQLISGKSQFPEILHAMEISFADSISRRLRTAEIIAPDAVQLAGLNKDYAAGRRSIFVTADRQLRDFVSASKYSFLGNAMISNVGLVQLVDLLIGGEFDPRGFATLFWSPKVSSRSELVRNYLIDRALESYDQAMAMEIPNLVNRCTEEILGSDSSDLNWDTNDPVERAKIRKYIDGFEDEYYRGMRESIEKREQQY